MGAGEKILMIALGVGIAVGIKSKKLTVTELVLCGMFGFLLASTGLGVTLHGAANALGSQLSRLAG